jgi:hypothetical protein
MNITPSQLINLKLLYADARTTRQGGRAALAFVFDDKQAAEEFVTEAITAAHHFQAAYAGKPPEAEGKLLVAMVTVLRDLAKRFKFNEDETPQPPEEHPAK